MKHLYHEPCMCRDLYSGLRCLPAEARLSGVPSPTPPCSLALSRRPLRHPRAGSQLRSTFWTSAKWRNCFLTSQLMTLPHSLLADPARLSQRLRHALSMLLSSRPQLCITWCWCMLVPRGQQTLVEPLQRSLQHFLVHHRAAVCSAQVCLNLTCRGRCEKHARKAST